MLDLDTFKVRLSRYVTFNKESISGVSINKSNRLIEVISEDKIDDITIPDESNVNMCLLSNDSNNPVTLKDALSSPYAEK